MHTETEKPNNRTELKLLRFGSPDRRLGKPSVIFLFYYFFVFVELMEGKKRSEVWQHFTLEGQGKNKKAKCNYCQK